MHDVERQIAALAGRQDNVITFWQLLEAGLGRGAIAHRVREGRYQKLHRGIYLIAAAPPTLMARARAAALAAGPHAVVSHRSAAELLGLLPHSEHDMDVTVPLRNSRHRPGIRIHRVSKLAKADVGHMRGMRVTTPARTVCDIAGSEHSHDAERALAEARIQRLLTDEDILGAIGRMGTRRGAALARQLLAHSDTGYTRSAAERRLLHLLRAAELPLPRTNFPLHGFSVDFFWPDQRLVVEVDGHQFHAHRSAFESDRRRDQVLVAAGYRVIRITWRQLKRQPLAVIARIAQALRAERAA